MSTMNSNDSQQTNEQILNDIQTLQTMEQQLFSNLENNPNLTTQQQQQIVEKMNQLPIVFLRYLIRFPQYRWQQFVPSMFLERKTAHFDNNC